MENKETTPEQRKAILKILSRARWNLLWIAAKFAAGLMITNIAAVFIAIAFLRDTQPETLRSFETLSWFINFLFMVSYLNGQTKKHSDKVNEDIKSVLKTN